ncbi:MAG: molybdopterin-dependent oxidoreductase [Desulfatiglandales bacterium]
MKRRDFIAITGAGAAAAIAPDIGYEAFWRAWGSSGYRHDWVDVPNGSEKYVNTICQQCPGGCGVTVRKIGGRAVKIDANPNHPVNNKGTCPKGQTALQVLYHPERIKGPMKRAGPRGSGEWEEISWDEAIETIKDKLFDLRAREQQHTVAFIDGEESHGLMQKLIRRFLKAYGSPNYIAKPSSVADERLMKAVPRDGTEGFYDFGKADYIISFSFNFNEAFYSPGQAIKAYSDFRSRKDTEFIFVGSRSSVTGIKSNEWIQANPGTEGLLAMGIAQVIIRDGLYDANFVNTRTSDFDEFQSAVLRVPLNDISEGTGVPEETIEELAHEFAKHGDKAVAIGNSGTSWDQAAINSLNLLTGSIQSLWWDYDEDAIPYSELPEFELDRKAENGISKGSLISPNRGDYPLARQVFGLLPDRILEENPYSINALFIYFSNPLLSVPNTQKMLKALEKVPFIVNFSPFMDETAQMSDLILPDHSPLEKIQDAPTYLLDGTPVLGLRQPIVGARHDTMQTGTALIRIAGAFGGSLNTAFPWSNFEDFMNFALQGVFESTEGGLVDGSSYGKFEDWRDALVKGAWWNPSKKEVFSRTADFNADYIRKIPTHRRHSEEYPFHLNIFKLMSLTKPRNTAQPSLFDIAAPNIYRKWVAWVEIDHETAHHLGIHDEDWVWVESPIGREKFKAKIYEGAMPEVVNIPMIIGSKGYGRWEKDVEQKTLDIVDDTLDTMDGQYIYDTNVKIYKV